MCATVEFPASICLAIATALLIGIANACVARPCEAKLLDAAVSMPSTRPAALISGPPESPGWIGAFVSSKPVSCSELPSSSLAVIV